MLFLNRATIAKVDADLIQEAVGQAYAKVMANDFNMPDRAHVGDGENMLLLMPCFSGQYFATKLVSVFPGAPELGEPSVNGMVVLSSNETGKPLAVMDGAALTAERTGAVGGMGVSLLTPHDLAVAGVMGAGVQGFSQARYALNNRDIKTMWIYDLHEDAALAMADKLGQLYSGVEFKVAESAEALVEKSQLIIAATTSSTPLFADDVDLVKGKTFISIGSFRPDMKEFPDAVISTADAVYADTPFATKESGDLCIPIEKKVVSEDGILPFAQLVERSHSVKPGETLFFKSVGMALFDLTTAIALYEICIQNNWGQTLEF
ncbi:MAG: ornithine cyclodeaminase family protein [Desulfobacterales bacterium]|nr:ornithine cyclodeaminase family protein [Desulfobacterales bacterium]